MEPRVRKRKKKRKNPVIDWLAYIALRMAMVVIYCFSIETNLRFACFLGKKMWKHYDRGRKRALDNLLASYPQKSQKWRIETGRRSFEQIAMLAIDVLFTTRLVKRDSWQEFSRYINLEPTKWLIQGGQGVLMVAQHYGNFEIMGYLMGQFGFNIYSIARPLDNKFINDYFYKVRRRAGQKIIDKKGATDQMEQMVSEGATLGFIADQDAGKKGIFVDFFGRKASTYKSIALIAMKYNMPIAVAGCRRVGNRFFFEIEIARLIMPDEWQDKDDPMKWITQEYVRATEEFVRKDPTQYWWLHRRWKTQPKGRRG